MVYIEVVMSFQYSYKPSYYPSAAFGENKFGEYLVKLQEMKKWCTEQNFINFSYAHGVFMFDNEKDYMMFLLRWS